MGVRIAHVHIENFRSVKSLDLDLPQMCCLVGPNNAGKSNILAAIHRVLGHDWVTVNSFDERDVYGLDGESEVSIDISVEPPVQYRRYKEAAPVDSASVGFRYALYKIGHLKGQRRLSQECKNADGGDIYVPRNAPKVGSRGAMEKLVGIPPEVRGNIPLIYIEANRTLASQLPGARNSLLGQLFEDIERDFKDPAQTVSSVGADGLITKDSRADRFAGLMQEVCTLLRTKSFEELERSIKTNALQELGFDPALDADKLDLYFGPFEPMDFYKSLDLRVREGEIAVSATEMGSGVQNAVIMAILRVFEERRKQGAIFLIEEPEVYLHPQMQRSLYKTMQEIAKTNQVIYSTHSAHFVSVSDYRNVVLVRKGPDGTGVTRAILPADRTRDEKFLKELDSERSELFFATRLLLVEGDTEKLALPEYARKLGIDLDRSGATIVEVGGKRNLPLFTEIALSFGIPTGILFDTDSNEFGKEEKAKEKEFNGKLEGLAQNSDSVRVWECDPAYESQVRAAIGEGQYQVMCQKHGCPSKPIQARRIAADPSTPIPPLLREVLGWLSGKSACSANVADAHALRPLPVG